MPYLKLTKELTYFSEGRIKQLFDDARIFVAWYSSISKGRRLKDKRTGRKITKAEALNRFAKVKGLLWALGYEPKLPGKGTTEIYRRMFRKAFPLIRIYYRKYRDRVRKA